MASNIFQNELTCSVCMNYFIDPVTIGCGHSFCMPCLCVCWEQAPRPPRCPVCRETSHQTTFKTNIVLKTRVFLARRARPYQFPRTAEQMCEIHLKTKNFFCEVIKDALCLLCCKAEEHVAHRHCSVDWIAEEYRGYVTLRRKMIRAEYQKVCPLLYKEEKRHLERIEKESKEILQQLKQSEDSMDLKGKLLRGMYEELKDMCHKPDMELLQHFENTLKRSESVQLHVTQPVDPQLSSWPITGLIGRLNRFQVYVSLDNEVVTGHIPLFEDLKRFLFGTDHLEVANNSARSKYFLAWGAQSFTSGQHYWEVYVGDCSNWVIGFCNDSWTMRNDMVLDSEGIFLLFCVKDDNGCSLFTSSPVLPQYVERPVGCVGVFLDYECGTVSFVNVADSSLICSFLSCSFSSLLKPFLCCGLP
ncbi:PREDICTED: tripartite motif-containing protein 43-like [Ceratotherium simum simum]|uniref:Tripartite motif-containing protein 43-like n=1 Tax=Ceratotherium simum simum TaxID=73337 RepID=A0ABM1CLT3_CERSS|nr:PREDICTED: tripartite motif-containing protein 43-like [Ceratotherium simum simum]